MQLTNEEKQRLYALLNKKGNVVTKEERIQRTNSNILLVDGNNTFIRCWAANPSLDDNGNHTGGIVGFLKSIGYAIKLLGPTRCIIVFDGVGGSFKRRKIFPQYKQNRKGRIRLNRTYEEMSDPKTEEEQMKKQFIRLLHYLQTLPINMVSVDHVEADDVIAYLATDQFKTSDKIYIMSSDKDFLQLCIDNVCVYSPTKKRIYGSAEVLDEYEIHPNNFVLFRALDGDVSDNIDGIKGAGRKTVLKHFPWVAEDTIHNSDEIIKHAEDLRNKYKVCEQIASNKMLIERNIALMQLKDTALTTIAQLYCTERLETKNIPLLNKGDFYTLIRNDMLDSIFPNYISWLDEVFISLNSVVRSD